MVKMTAKFTIEGVEYTVTADGSMGNTLGEVLEFELAVNKIIQDNQSRYRLVSKNISPD